MSKIHVMVADNGKVIATHNVDKQADGVNAQMSPLPGQTLHEIEFDMPDHFKNSEEVRKFHAAVGEFIDRKK